MSILLRLFDPSHYIHRVLSDLIDWWQRGNHPAAIRLSDPIAGALDDIDLLLAFAAQSSRKIKGEKVKVLQSAAERIRTALGQKQTPPAADVANFWIAYDDLADDMAPLSAHSIRSSMQVNCRRFPRSLFTPSAINAALAVLVFMVCLALQGFWVAGKELIERADAIDKERGELQRKYVEQHGLLRRSDAKQMDLVRLCGKPCQKELGPPVRQAGGNDLLRDAAVQADLDANYRILIEKDIVLKEIADELEKINERGRPLEVLLEAWHNRAGALCDSRAGRYICPVDSPRPSTKMLADQLRQDIRKLRQKMVPASANYGYGGLVTQGVGLYGSSALLPELRDKEHELLRLEEDRFRSTVLEARIIVANLGTYLIAMVMGVLGALTFILRSLGQQLQEHTYVPMSVSVSIVRVCLGAIAGVFGSLLAAPGVDPTLKSLPPLFIPFVFGYGIEILFSLLDKVTRTFTQAEQGRRPT